MTIDHNGMLMRIYLAETSRSSQHRDAYRAVVEALAAAGFAGATVFKGIAGFGAGGRLSSDRAIDAWTDLPILVEVVDAEPKVRAFVEPLEALLVDGLITLERVQTLFCHDAAGSQDNAAEPR